MPAIDTVRAETANWCWVVLGGLLSFSARQDMKHAILTLTIASLLATTAFADPIHDAAKIGDLAGVQAELDKGVDVHAKDGDGNEFGTRLQTPLHWAATKEIAELLIAEGADVDAREKGGGTPLDKAILLGQTEIADLLRKHGGKTGKELKAAGK